MARAPNPRTTAKIRTHEKYPYGEACYKYWRYRWGTVRHPDPPREDRPWPAWKQYGPVERRNVDKVVWFAKRSSAKRAAKRWCRTHERRNERQKLAAHKKSRCPNCETRPKLKDDYLCRKCRYG